MKKLYATILYTGIFFVILFPFNLALAYSVGTHALLTKEIVEYYNKNFPKSAISDSFRDYLVDGARLEDNTPRYVNHFYDPVNDRGLADGGFRGQKSKEWANDSSAQTAFLYRSFSPTEASILSLAQVDKISSVFDQSDFTWEKAIGLYLDGKKEEAFFVLGHIIHLIEDVSVPDHVRNDSHPPYDNGGSPYENWTAKFNLDNSDTSLKSRLVGKKPILLGELDSYFNDLAGYTNNNFYSADSINGFNLPNPDNFIDEGIYRYGIKFDEFGSRYHLIAFKKKSISIIDQVINESSSLSDFKINNLGGDRFKIGTLNDYSQNYIISDYWDRLSVKSIQYGAGVIDLFFKEVEKERNNQTKKTVVSKGYFAQVIDLLRDLLPDFGGDQNLNLVATIDLENKDIATVKNSKALEDANTISDPEFINIQDFTNDSQDEDLIVGEPENISEEEISQVIVPVIEKKPDQVCTFNTDKAVQRGKLLINEVAWMGGINSANDEWIELRNISGGILDISGWQLLDKAEQIKITFRSMKLDPGAYLLLERTDDNSILEIKADAVYAGALSNSDEGLRLFDNECSLMDEVLADQAWPAGDASARRTMERSPDFSWYSFEGGGSVRGGISIFGTPRQDNSQPGMASVSSTPAPSVQIPDASVEKIPKKILISEIQITGGTGKSDNDFIELYNPGAEPVNLNGYRLVKRTKSGTSDSSIKSWTTDSYIPAHGYYLWANSNFTSIAIPPDVSTSATLSNDNGIAIRFGAADTGEIIDSVAWGAATSIFVESQAFPENPGGGQSISRKSENDTGNNAADFLKTVPSPKNSGSSEGFNLPTTWSSQSASTVSHLLISEIYPDQTGSNLDFVEIYNPNATGTPPANLAGWSLQVLSANATSTDKIAKKNFENQNLVPPSGFFLVGIDDFSGADMSWASGSLNSTDGATIFLVNGTTTISDFEDPKIIDKLAYGSGSGLLSAEGVAAPLPESGTGLERKSLHNGLCVSATGAGEYFGNGCDTDDNSEDFEIRATSTPQRSANLIEPRNTPTRPADFTATYDSGNLRMNLSWIPSVDSSGATSSISYILKYATSTNTLIDLAVLSATSTYDFKISEVGIDYFFSITTKDSDGLMSPASSISTFVPSIFDSAYFYPDPRSAGSNAIELRYSSYPFIYPTQTDAGFRVAVFYKNQEAPALSHFYSDTQYATTPDGVFPKEHGEWGTTISSAWKLDYANCSGNNTQYTSLIFPDASENCSVNFGGVRNNSLNFSQLEDLNLIVRLASDQIAAAGDYFTAGYYVHTGYNTQNLAVVDRTKYYFQSDVPTHASPTAPTGLELSFNPANSRLRIIWSKSSDSDSLDNLLNYEINYGTTTLSDSGWIPAPNVSMDSGEGSQINGRPFTKISVEPNTTYNIALRAKDDFGNVSEATTTVFAVPDIVLPYGMAGLAWGNLDQSGLKKINFTANGYPFMNSSNKPSAILFFLNQAPPTGHSFSNSANRYEIGGNNRVLKLKYSTCDNANDELLGGLLMHNQSSCPNGSGLKKFNTRNDLTAGQTSFSTEISGVFENGGAVSYDFTAEDYVTLGFYELSGSTFQEVSTYNKKIYFSQ